MLVRVLYGIKCIIVAWHVHLSQNIYDLIYKPCEVYPYVWMKSNSKLDGFLDYEHVFICVDDAFSVRHKPSVILDSINKLYHLKEPLV